MTGPTTPPTQPTGPTHPTPTGPGRTALMWPSDPVQDPPPKPQPGPPPPLWPTRPTAFLLLGVFLASVSAGFVVHVVTGGGW